MAKPDAVTMEVAKRSTLFIKRCGGALGKEPTALDASLASFDIRDGNYEGWIGALRPVLGARIGEGRVKPDR